MAWFLSSELRYRFFDSNIFSSCSRTREVISTIISTTSVSTYEKRPPGLNLTPRLKLLADHLLSLLFLTEAYNLPLFFKTLNLNVHVCMYEHVSI